MLIVCPMLSSPSEIKLHLARQALSQSSVTMGFPNLHQNKVYLSDHVLAIGKQAMSTKGARQDHSRGTRPQHLPQSHARTNDGVAQ